MASRTKPSRGPAFLVGITTEIRAPTSTRTLPVDVTSKDCGIARATHARPARWTLPPGSGPTVARAEADRQSAAARTHEATPHRTRRRGVRSRHRVPAPEYHRRAQRPPERGA